MEKLYWRDYIGEFILENLYWRIYIGEFILGGLLHTLILDLLLFFEKNLFIYFGGSFTYTYSRFFIILENLFMGGLVHTLILLSAILGYLPANLL